MNQFYLYFSVFFCKTEVCIDIVIQNTKNRKLKAVMKNINRSPIHKFCIECIYSIE